MMWLRIFLLNLNRVVVWNKVITNKRQYWNILKNFIKFEFWLKSFKNNFVSFFLVSRNLNISFL